MSTVYPCIILVTGENITMTNIKFWVTHCLCVPEFSALLLLQFPSGSFLLMGALVLSLFSTFRPSFRSVAGRRSAAGPQDWKNFCRAAWVLWAEAVHDCVAELRFAGLGTGLMGVDNTEVKRWDDGWPAVSHLGAGSESVMPLLLKGLTVGLKSVCACWWTLQTRDPESAPNLNAPDFNVP